MLMTLRAPFPLTGVNGSAVVDLVGPEFNAFRGRTEWVACGNRQSTASGRLSTVLDE